ncbi:hypothetical protein L9F63_027590, partial [Diploptera punctata]
YRNKNCAKMTQFLHKADCTRTAAVFPFKKTSPRSNIKYRYINIFGGDLSLKPQKYFISQKSKKKLHFVTAEVFRTMTRFALATVRVITFGAPYIDRISDNCEADKLTVYKVILQTFWTRDQFPKHYPDWRPPAQWSKLIGRQWAHSYLSNRFNNPSSPETKRYPADPKVWYL